MERYSHTQVGYYLIVIYSLAIMIAAYLLRPFSRNLLSQVGLITLLLALVTFATMKVTVDDKKIQIRLGFGAIRKSFSTSEVETYQIVKNPWYYLLGIRYTPRGWLYAVSGHAAIELQMKNGKIYRIGTDDPNGFASALDEALRGLEV